MAKFYGFIGYGLPVQITPNSGIWEDQITERVCFGDVLQNISRSEGSETLHNDVVLQNSISVVADEFVTNHIHAIRYIKWNEGYWTVTTVEVKPPRLIFRLGSVYNGPRPNPEADLTPDPP